METSNSVLINWCQHIKLQILIIIVIIKNRNQFYNGFGALKTLKQSEY